MSKTKISYIVFMAVSILTMLIVGTFIDLDISHSMYVPDSILDLLGGFLGKLPAFIMLAICFAILMNYVRVHQDLYKKPVAITLTILYIIAILMSYVLAFYSAFEEMTSKAKYIAVILGGVSAIITILIASRCTFSHQEELKKWAVLTTISIVVLMLLVVVIKNLWGRARYEDVISTGQQFSVWYFPQGVGGGHSLPSGHTALWGALYMLLPLFSILGYKGEGWTFVAIMSTQLLVGLFRIMGGHHYLTDITIAMALSFAVAMITVKIGYKDDFSNKSLGAKSIFRYI